MMQLSRRETIAFSVSPKFEAVCPHCACGEVAYRLVGIFEDGLRKETPLCTRHFAEACVQYPLLPYLELGESCSSVH